MTTPYHCLFDVTRPPPTSTIIGINCHSRLLQSHQSVFVANFWHRIYWSHLSLTCHFSERFQHLTAKWLLSPWRCPSDAPTSFCCIDSFTQAKRKKIDSFNSCNVSLVLSFYNNDIDKQQLSEELLSRAVHPRYNVVHAIIFFDDSLTSTAFHMWWDKQNSRPLPIIHFQSLSKQRFPRTNISYLR